jgi:hypothetical protein
LFKPLIGSFACAIGAWVEHGRNILLDVKKSAEFVREMRDESGVAVADNLSRDAEPWH